MEYQGIIITGTSAAGKSIVARKLCEEHDVFQLVQAVTTRESREDDKPQEYNYISEEEFEKLDREGKLLIKSEYGDQYYGITYEALQQVVDNDKTPLLILTPKSVKELEARGQKHYIFFLDAPDDILNRRLARRGGEIDETIEKQRQGDRKYPDACHDAFLYTIKNIDMEKTAELIWNLWEYRKTGGILPKRLIQLMIECGMLLENAYVTNTTGAAYDLTLDDQYYSEGEVKSLNEKNSFIKIEPGDYVLVASREIANFPKDIAGRFDLSVSLFCQGIILSNGPQVDPGFRGRLFCLLFNTSNDVVQLKRYQHYATIEFSKLIHPTVPYVGKYQDKSKIMEYLPKSVARGAITELRKDVEILKSEKWWIKILPLTVSALAIVLAIISFIISLFR